MTVKLSSVFNDYTVLSFSTSLPSSYKHITIDGVQYDPIIAYDMPNSIGIKAEINATGKDVIFS